MSSNVTENEALIGRGNIDDLEAILAVSNTDRDEVIHAVRDNADAIFTWDYENGARPALNKLYEKYRSSGFVLLGVNVDDDTRQAAGVADKLGVKFPVLPDADKRVSRQYDLSAMPSTVLIDRDGKVRYLHRGYQSGYEDTYDKQIRELLKE